MMLELCCNLFEGNAWNWAAGQTTPLSTTLAEIETLHDETDAQVLKSTLPVLESAYGVNTETWLESHMEAVQDLLLLLLQ